jgi:DNA-binding beta-propeller fold protein YncE
MEQKGAFDMSINQLSVMPQTSTISHQHAVNAGGFETRGSNSPISGAGGDIFSTADMFQGGEANRVSRKNSDDMAPPKSSIVRQKINIATKFGDFGQAPGLFSEPSGVAINPLNGNILIADTNNHRVEVNHVV